MIPSSDLPDQKKAGLQTLPDPLFEQKKIRIDVLRLDKIHTIVSGNKWFKLKYYLQAAAGQGKSGIISFGGPYSNHLIATAYICKQARLKSIGIIRGEEPAAFSATLHDMQSYGMSLQFYSRQTYKDPHLVRHLQDSYPDFLLIEEGGRGLPGVKGAEEILHLIPFNRYTHILCAVGTGTMITGIINTALPTQHVIGISTLKLDQLHHSETLEFIHSNSSRNLSLLNSFHFGGYARKNNQLIDFMNHFYQQHTIPTDFVYTGKLFYGTMKLVEQNFFKAGAHILVIHSGGLQGNRSLKSGTLDFSF